jgi:hypothetical protein
MRTSNCLAMVPLVVLLASCSTPLGLDQTAERDAYWKKEAERECNMPDELQQRACKLAQERQRDQGRPK